MKKLKICLCAMLVLFSGVMFAACGEKNQDFNIESIQVVGETSFVYDGESHVFAVKYQNIDLNVTYSINDRTNFKTAENLNVVNAGSYNIYYKLSATGFNDYISSEAIPVTITPREATIIVGENNTILNSNLNNQDYIVGNKLKEYNWSTSGIVPGDRIELEIEIGNRLEGAVETQETFNKDTAEAGDVYKLHAISSGNQNYNLSFQDGKLTITDNVALVKADGTVAYYSNLQDAITEADDSVARETIKLYNDVEVAETVNFNKSIIIDGQGKYSITAANAFTGTNMFELKTNKYVDIQNVTINANRKARVIMAAAGYLELNDAIVTGGHITDNSNFAPGVFITGPASFRMVGGSITNNTLAENHELRNVYYAKNSLDLWIGANAQSNVNGVGASEMGPNGPISLTGATIGSIFVNANSYSATNAGKLVMNGGNVNTVYVEHYAGYGANFEHKAGTIASLMIATGNADGEYTQFSNPVANRVYKGGYLIEVAKEGSVYYVENLNDALVEDETNITLYKNVILGNTLNVNRSAVINGQGQYIIAASDEFNDTNLINIQTAGTILTLQDVTVDANKQARAIRTAAGKLVLNDSHVTGGQFTLEDDNFAPGVFITGAAQFEMNGGSITGNGMAEDYTAGEYKVIYSTDLWIGANAKGALVAIKGGTIGNTFVNANEYSANNPGMFTMEAGEIENVYVESYYGYNATFNYLGGEVGTVRIGSGYDAGDYLEVETPTYQTYTGGTVIVTNYEMTVMSKYLTLEEAIAAAPKDSYIVLCKDVEISSTITINKTLYIASDEERTISASETFEGREMFLVNNANAKLTLMNVIIDAKEQARVIKVTAGELVVEGATITGGKVDDSYIGGVYITHAGKFTMKDGNITGNNVGDEYATDGYLQYSADLWIGANATGALASITGGKVGSVFVNANAYSANNPGAFTLSGGEIDNIYVEYNEGHGATFTYQEGEIGKLYISTTETGTATEVNPVEGTVYKGGLI